MLIELLKKADLFQFDGEVTEGGTSQAGTQPANVGAEANSQTADDKSVQAPKTPEQLREEYHELIKGEYKDIHTKEFQKHLNRRLADMRKLSEENESQKKLIDLVASKYGVTDLEELEKLIEADNHMLENEAYEKGIPVETLAKERQLEANLRRLKEEAERERNLRIEMERQQKERQQYAQWLREAEAIKEQYPDFDLNAEAENPQFVSMLQSGVDLKHAYEVLHMDDIVSQTAKKAMNTSAKAVASTIAARGQRPSENANSSNSSVVYKRDVSSLTAKDREEIARRVARGEKISF